MYAADYDGKYTEKLSDLYPDYVTSLDVFTCPSAGGPPITRKEDIDSLTSYVLRKGLTEASPPDEVLIYESLENHRGDGGNAAFIDGHVKWMSASTLQRIIEKDQESHLPAVPPALGQAGR
jgi:prepilin-type processing-associated H-X9-DG protein